MGQKFNTSTILFATLMVSCLIIQLTIRNGQLIHLYGNDNLCGANRPPEVVVSRKDHLHLEVERLRFQIAKESFRMMMEDTEEAASKSFVADISPMVEIMIEALQTVGVRQVHEKVLTTQEFAVSLTDAAKDLGIKGFRTHQKQEDDQPMITYFNVPSNRKFARKKSLCHGHLWWLRHIVGSVVADQLLVKGSLPLDVLENTTISNPREYLEEMRRLARSDYPDPLHFHSQHGFAWEWLARKRPQIDSYPLDMLNEFCGDLVWKDEWVEDQHNDIGRECRHSFGHALYYVLAAQELGENYNITARNTFRVASNFYLSEDSICKLEELCLGSPNKGTLVECRGGFWHSFRLYSVGDFNQNITDYMAKATERCQSRPSYQKLKAENPNAFIDAADMSSAEHKH
ncbi:hypothetical protein IV203_025659 [Nitzschia inconspicua]|uniref:Uncharacterized protein n=1 Tax=Nitzschia inconspicua TaxID=303405 RepID=A0A9K3PW92_9STRA|nr:hypothetical protein IV203_025659 [Nitzschia inconspicua]